jgi:6-phosphogluconate dehydrogenase|tara:strand:- start:448 stop:648 length:201 start_codon:yes stop_codon:yes gene_type:complete
VFDAKADLAHLLLAPAGTGAEAGAGLVERVVTSQPSWRRVVSLCVASGIPCPAMGAALAYFDSCVF